MGNCFVVQEHTTPDGVHWDLMLEQGEVLTTFRLEQPPQVALDRAVSAVKIFDHPLRFLTYEGSVQKGTGQVKIVDRGTYAVPSRTDDTTRLELRGEVLQGGFVLIRSAGTAWQLAPLGPGGTRDV